MAASAPNSTAPEPKSRCKSLASISYKCLQLYLAATLHDVTVITVSDMVVRALRSHPTLDRIMFQYSFVLMVLGSAGYKVGRPKVLRFLPAIAASVPGWAAALRGWVRQGWEAEVQETQGQSLPPLLSAAVLLAARLTAGQVARGVRGVSFTGGEVELVPISGRVRGKLPGPGYLEDVFKDDDGVRFLEQLLIHSIVPEGGGELLSPDHPTTRAAHAKLAALYQAAKQLARRAHGPTSDAYQRVLTMGEGCGDPEPPLGVVRMPAKSTLQGRETMGCASMHRMVVLEGASVGIVAHELAHVLCRHSMETSHWLYERGLQCLVRELVHAFCAAPLKKALGLPRCPPLASAGAQLLADKVEEWMDDRWCVAPEGARGRSLAALKVVQEMEADRVATLLLGRAGFHPVNILLRSMDSEERIRGGDGEDLISNVHELMARRSRWPPSRLTPTEIRRKYPDSKSSVWSVIQVWDEACLMHEEHLGSEGHSGVLTAAPSSGGASQLTPQGRHTQGDVQQGAQGAPSMSKV